MTLQKDNTTPSNIWCNSLPFALMSILSLYSKHILFNQFCCTYHTSSSNAIKLWVIIGSILHLLVTTCILVLCAIYEEKVFTQVDPLATFVDVMQMVFPLWIHVMVILEAFMKSRLDEKVEKLVKKVERDFQEEGIDLTPSDSVFKRRFFVRSVIFQGVSLLVEIYIISTITSNPDWTRAWLARIFSYAYTRLAISHCVFMVGYVSTRLSVLNTELLSLGDYSKIKRLNAIYDPIMFKKLKYLKGIYGDLWRILDLHTQRHSWFIIGSITSFIICLTVDFYWMYANLYYGGNPYILRESLLFSSLQ